MPSASLLGAITSQYDGIEHGIEIFFRVSLDMFSSLQERQTQHGIYKIHVHQSNKRLQRLYFRHGGVLRLAFMFRRWSRGIPGVVARGHARLRESAAGALLRISAMKKSVTS